MEDGYLKIAITAALQAGNDILKIYNDPLSDFQIEKKADNSPLTIADKAAHRTIVSYLEQTPFPVLSEEGKNIPYDERKKWDELWIVDPLDGTKEFIKRNGEFTVNIARIRQGTPVLGVIYIPVLKTLYYSTETAGAFQITDIEYSEKAGTCHDMSGDPDFWEQLRFRSRKLPLPETHDGTVVVASRSHLSPETEQFIETVKEQKGPITLKSSGSSIKICLVAQGTADLYPRFAPTMEWDTAAGHAIAKEAGKEIYRTDSDTPLRYNKPDLMNPWFIVEPKRII